MKPLQFIATAAISAVIVAGACRASADPEDNDKAAKSMPAAREAVAAEGAKAVTEWKGPDRISPDAKLPVIIDFNASWCGPCRMFKPVFAQAALSFSGRAKFISVNVDDYPGAARQFGVQGIPQVSVLYPDGTVQSATGYMDQPVFDAFVSDALR